MRALALEHITNDPIGVFGDVLTERGIGVDRVLLHEGESLPDWRSYDLIVAMGAHASVWQEDEYPWIAQEKRTIRDAVLAGMPYFGVCFGVQLLADVFGGQSFRGPEPEIGVDQVFLTAAAQHDPVFRGFPPDLEVCEWHSNHFSLPPGAVRLARSPRYGNQAIRYGRVAYGIQCHLEVSLRDIREWFEEFPDTAVLLEKRHGSGAVARLLDDYGDFVPFLQQTARQVFGRWLQHAITIGAVGQALPPRPLPHRSNDVGSAELFGRGGELARIDAAIVSARRGESAVLALRGEAGAGKSALLKAAGERARGLRVVRTGADGARWSEHPFAALAALCTPFADERGALSPERARAVAAILDLDYVKPGQDRFGVYAGALDLLVAAAAQGPLLVLVDDAHLLDDGSREAIAFIATRLRTDGVGVIIATESEDELLFAEDLRLTGLEPPDARALLEHRWRDALAPPVAEAIVSAAEGNPLALLEIPVDLSPAQRAAEAPLEKPLPTSAEMVYLNRVSALSAETRQALVVAALADGSERGAIPAACQALGIDSNALNAGAASGLVRRDPEGVSFVHPLARVVVSYSALRTDRRAAHAALATVTSREPRTWHLARAAAHPDESIASALEQIALRARDRTAFAAAAAGLEWAARLTPDRDKRAQRLLDAAGAAHQAGHVNASLDHIDAALLEAGPGRIRREVEHLRGRIIARSGSAEIAREQLIAAASRSERTEQDAAAQILADAVLPALRAGDPHEAVRLARRAARLSVDGSSVSVDVALGTALIFAGEYPDGAARLDAAEARAEQASDLQQLTYLGAGLGLAGRHAAARRLLTEVTDAARASGAISLLPYALIRLADVHLETGRWTAAASALHEALSLARETGQPADAGLALGSLGWLAGARGQVDQCASRVHEALQIAGRLGVGSRLDRAGTAIGLLELGNGHPDGAIPHLEAACQLQDEQGWSDASRTPHRRPDLVEAYALAGLRDRAVDALDRFGVDPDHSGRPSALAALERCRGLMAAEDELDETFAAAHRTAGAECGPFETARTDLLYGLRLLEAGRDQDALRALGSALARFDELAALSWAQRARDGIRAAGGSLPAPRISVAERLTPLELEVALAATKGASPREIAERLFLGPRTVQMQLASAAIKLGLESTAGLAEVVGQASERATAGA
ncbi:MAG: AAA family ATPase [Actinomycetota bacterium]|nr:AAA family ATPase [Actinomycetota bacterium]